MTREQEFLRQYGVNNTIIKEQLENPVGRVYLTDMLRYWAEITQREILQGLLDSAGIIHFKAHEFLMKGSSHCDQKSPAFGKNTVPPNEILGRIIPVAIVLDDIREELGAPISLKSVFRSPEYNILVGGSDHSQHMEFTTCDCKTKKSKLADLYHIAMEHRDYGQFSGGIGLYGTFVHIDTRGRNATW